MDQVVTAMMDESIRPYTSARWTISNPNSPWTVANSVEAREDGGHGWLDSLDDDSDSDVPYGDNIQQDQVGYIVQRPAALVPLTACKSESSSQWYHGVYGRDKGSSQSCLENSAGVCAKARLEYDRQDTNLAYEDQYGFINGRKCVYAEIPKGEVYEELADGSTME
ncbi:hypothetical protein BGZ51_009221 [Haplosporangium sp. Z 767]|nr:hypothetical protein BGZ50_003955 [Haplosporangium sp. Z 11]KAF9189852.1 hypothetical protein BGZ51_009221 [Haplosporangium sp. Z 767]